MHNLDFIRIEFDLLSYNLVHWFHVYNGLLCYLAYRGWRIFLVNVADRFNNQGPKRRTSSVHISFVDASNSVKRLYQVQVLMTFLKRMLFLQRGYFDLNFLLTITADLDSCIHNVHWAFISSVGLPVIT